MIPISAPKPVLSKNFKLSPANFELTTKGEETCKSSIPLAFFIEFWLANSNFILGE